MVAGFVNLVAPGKTDYYFDDVPQSVPQLGKYILIYQRKSQKNDEARMPND
jgi:hypothetical protein